MGQYGDEIFEEIAFYDGFVDAQLLIKIDVCKKFENKDYRLPQLGIFDEKLLLERIKHFFDMERFCSYRIGVVLNSEEHKKYWPILKKHNITLKNYEKASCKQFVEIFSDIHFYPYHVIPDLIENSAENQENKGELK